MINYSLHIQSPDKTAINIWWKFSSKSTSNLQSELWYAVLVSGMARKPSIRLLISFTNNLYFFFLSLFYFCIQIEDFKNLHSISLWITYSRRVVDSGREDKPFHSIRIEDKNFHSKILAIFRFIIYLHKWHIFIWEDYHEQKKLSRYC